MDRAPRRLIVKARQIGFSQAIALEALHEALYQRDATILLVSRNGDLAANLLGYCYQALAGLTDAPRPTKTNEGELRFPNGSRIKSLPANRSTGRGFAGRSVYLDEFAYQDFAEEIYRSVSPIVGHGGRLTVCSTPDGRGNFFYRLWSGAEAGQWSRHVVPWRLCPVYDDAWFARERPKYTASDWASEYECDFVASGNAVFRAEDVAACADGWGGLRPPTQRRAYVTAWDIGRRNDATVGITLDLTEDTFQVVAFERLLGVSYPLIQAAIEKRAKAYPGATYVESNGVGDPVVENLTVAVWTWTTTAKTKAQAIASLVLAHEQRRFKHGIEQLKQECLLYQHDDRGLIQDCVIAAAIAVHCAFAALPGTELVTYDEPIEISPF